MSAGRLANLALVLAITGWLLAFYGAMSQLGDPSPMVPRSVIEGQRHLSLSVLLLGIVSLLSALWLSGAAFGGARRRSVLVVALIVLPVITVVADLY